MQCARISVIYVMALVFPCNGVSWRRQLEHIAKSRLQRRGRHIDDFFPSRRFFQYDPRELSSIIAVPSRVSHLPEAEPIMPGHTLLRPSFGMLKSSLKFPHKEMVDGAGVNGNMNNLGIKYDSRNERLLYSGFRRFPSDYIMIVPEKRSKYKKSRFTVLPVVLDLEQKERAESNLQKILKKLNLHKGMNILATGVVDDDFDDPMRNHHSYYLSTNKINTLKQYKPLLRTNEKEDVKEELRAIHDRETFTAPPVTTTNRGLEKIKWILDSRDRYNNIKINQGAPDINELIPAKEINKLRQWWFYNVEDFQPFYE